MTIANRLNVQFRRDSALTRPIVALIAATATGIALLLIDHVITLSAPATAHGAIGNWWLASHLAIMLIIPFVMLWFTSQPDAHTVKPAQPEYPLVLGAVLVTVGCAVLVAIASAVPLTAPFAAAAMTFASSGPFVSLGFWCALFLAVFAVERRDRRGFFTALAIGGVALLIECMLYGQCAVWQAAHHLM